MYTIEDFMRQIDYTFSEQALLKLALTHSSHANERATELVVHNERLEFLGDSVLSIVISQHLYQNYPKLPEGELTKLRARIVCEQTLADVATKLNLGMFMYFGKGEARTGGRQRKSILADALEAVIAAVYLDGGFLEAQRFIETFFKEKIEQAVKGKIFLDYKTALQEQIQATTQGEIKYQIVRERGPDHLKEFCAQVLIDSTVMGEGCGKSKKEAEQAAATQALNRLIGQDDD